MATNGNTPKESDIFYTDWLYRISALADKERRKKTLYPSANRLCEYWKYLKAKDVLMLIHLLGEQNTVFEVGKVNENFIDLINWNSKKGLRIPKKDYHMFTFVLMSNVKCRIIQYPSHLEAFNNRKQNSHSSKLFFVKNKKRSNHKKPKGRFNPSQRAKKEMFLL